MAEGLLRSLFPTQLATFLEDYKRRGSNAQPYLVFTFFTELLFQRGIVLVRGDVINNSLSKPEAERVWEQLEASYCQEGNFELVHNFNNNTHLFNEQLYNETYGISN